MTYNRAYTNVINLNTCTCKKYISKPDNNFSDFRLNFRFQINSNRISSDRSFGHKYSDRYLSLASNSNDEGLFCLKGFPSFLKEHNRVAFSKFKDELYWLLQTEAYSIILVEIKVGKNGSLKHFGKSCNKKCGVW